MVFSVKSASLSSRSFNKTFVHTAISTSLPALTLKESKDLYGPPKITFVADVSGSMMPNMTILKNSLLVLIDMAGPGSCVRVLAFDETSETIIKSTVLSKDSMLTLKNCVRERLVNNGKSTNLQQAIHACLSGDVGKSEELEESNLGSDPQLLQVDCNEEQITLFASDGFANLGLTSSKELLTFARTFETYSKQTFYTLGIKLTPHVELNSELLKDMALDSGGSFRVTSTSEGIAEFLGDVFAHHYFVRFLNMQFTCTSSNGCAGTLCTKLSKRGGILRGDRPLELVWEFPWEAQAPFTLKASMDKRPEKGSGLLKETLEVSLQPEPCSHTEIEKIFGCTLLAPAKDRLFTLENLKEKIQQLEKFLTQSPEFQKTVEIIIESLKRSLEDFELGGEQTTQDSMDSFAWSSGGGAVLSVQAEQLRSTALQATQAFGEEDTLFDSQKTVESESTKRQRKNF